MEPDFVTRQHLDSVNIANDPSTFELLNKYKFPPVNPQIPISQPQNFGNYQPPNDNSVFFSNMLGQIQGSLQQLGVIQKVPTSNGLDGVELKINADVLRWVLLVVILLILIWVILKIQNKQRQNPLRRRLRKLEKQIRKLKRMNPKKLKQLTQDDLDSPDDSDESDDELDALL